MLRAAALLRRSPQAVRTGLAAGPDAGVVEDGRRVLEPVAGACRLRRRGWPERMTGRPRPRWNAGT
ncbi:hypothetical protein AB0F18_24775, partial [Streptomyces sp. NPDC029216]|uniref:hypothetical protein n=1 Tax=Streptomyces sp. NPDC029216 TaxID=3154701 RepID=UPI00340876F2